MQGPNVLERRGGKTLETSLIAGSSYGRPVADNFSASTHARKNSIDQKRLMPIANSVKLKYPYEILRPCCTFHLDLLVLVKGKKTRKVLLSPVQNKSIRGTEI